MQRAGKTFTFENNNKVIQFNAKQICAALKYKQPKIASVNSVEKSDKIPHNSVKINCLV